MSGSEKEALLNVFAALVRPLMRAAFEYGITASEIASVVRRTYIQALEAKLVEQKRPATDARLSVVSGLPKSDVSALREALRLGASHGGVRANADQAGILLTVWHTHSNFSGAYGLAMDLDLTPMPGSPRRSFQDLVDIACPGADRDALLDELLAVGSVEVVDGSTLRCLSRALVQRGADTSRIERTGRFLAAVADNFVHNLLRAENDPAYFERAVVCDEPLSEQGRDQFLRVGGERAQELLAELDTFLIGLADENKEVLGKKYGVGIYFFEDKVGEGVKKSEKTSSEQSDDVSKVVSQEIDVLAVPSSKLR